MAIIDYANIFDRLGPIVVFFDYYETQQTSLALAGYPFPYVKEYVAAEFASQGVLTEISTLESSFTGVITQLTQLKTNMVTWVENMFKDVGILLGEEQTTITAILTRLSEAMREDDYYLVPRTVIVNTSDVNADGTIVPGIANIGTGKLVYTFTKPDGYESEISCEETMHCQCTNSTIEDSEVFALSGETNRGRLSFLGQGSGIGSSLTVAGNNLTDGSFEDWDAGELVEWTLASGVWATDISQEETIIYEGTSSLKSLVGGSGAWQLTQTLATNLEASSMYAIGFWARREAGATGSIFIEFLDADEEQVIDDELEVTVASLATDGWDFYYGFIKTPSHIPTGLVFSLRAVDIAVASHYIDYVQYTKLTKHNQMYWGIFAGNTHFVVGDRFGYGGDYLGIRVEVDTEGTYSFQRFIGRCFGVQLPSTVPNGVTIISDPSLPV